MASWVSSMIRSTSSTDITWRRKNSQLAHWWPADRRREYFPVAHLVHFFQTFISDFQPVDDFPFNLGKLQVLNLKRAEKKKEEVVSWALLLHAERQSDPPLTHHALQVAYLVLRLVQKLILVAFLFQQEECFPVWTQKVLNQCHSESFIINPGLKDFAHWVHFLSDTCF